jgi:2-polyprenyl-3-methyl-5-hydroxy-6-metoxy-1,4-benzoquinol methylase
VTVDQTAEVQADFDRLAWVPDEAWEVNSHYHTFLLHSLPAHCSYALDIGCGTGAFSRLLAGRSDHVLGLDFSSQMIRVARERSQGYGNIEFEVVDVRKWEFPQQQFDGIASIATMHHLPPEEMMLKIKAALRPGGVLAILDLYRAQSVADLMTGALAMPVHWILRLVKTGRLRRSREASAAWAQHGRHDHYLTLAQVRAACASLLPGAEVRRHLLWRYSIVWKRPTG